MMSAKDAASLDPLYYNKDQFIDTKALSDKVRNYLYYNQIPWERFARVVLGIGQSRLSVLLGQPESWDTLKLRVKTYYMRMNEWMDVRATYGNNPYKKPMKNIGGPNRTKQAKRVKLAPKPRTLFTWDKKREEEEAQRATDQLTWDKKREEEEAQRATDLLIAANLDPMEGIGFMNQFQEFIQHSTPIRRHQGTGNKSLEDPDSWMDEGATVTLENLMGEGGDQPRVETQTIKQFCDLTAEELSSCKVIFPEYLQEIQQEEEENEEDVVTHVQILENGQQDNTVAKPQVLEEDTVSNLEVRDDGQQADTMTNLQVPVDRQPDDAQLPEVRVDLDQTSTDLHTLMAADSDLAELGGLPDLSDLPGLEDGLASLEAIDISSLDDSSFVLPDYPSLTITKLPLHSTQLSQDSSMTFSVSGEEESSFKICNVTSLAEVEFQGRSLEDADPSVGSPQGQALQILGNSLDDADMSFLCPEDKEEDETVHGGVSSIGIPIAAQDDSGISTANQECYFH